MVHKNLYGTWVHGCNFLITWLEDKCLTLLQLHIHVRLRSKPMISYLGLQYENWKGICILPFRELVINLVQKLVEVSASRTTTNFNEKTVSTKVEIVVFCSL